MLTVSNKSKNFGNVVLLTAPHFASGQLSCAITALQMLEKTLLYLASVSSCITFFKNNNFDENAISAKFSEVKPGKLYKILNSKNK